MPSSDGSNQDSDLMFSQLDSGMKVWRWTG